jgi:NAD kinase
MIAVVTRETRLAGLRARWGTAKAAKFRMQHFAGHEVELRRKQKIAAGARAEDLDEDALAQQADALAEADVYEAEDDRYQRAVQQLLGELKAMSHGFRVKTIDRSFLPNFNFFGAVMIVVIGPDGLVANAAKYAFELPIIGVNPDPAVNDGVLLPFEVRQAAAAVRRVLDRRAKIREVTLAEVTTNDDQRLLAFNDFFVGASSHVSARYTLEAGGRSEPQSSSGILISTGAGSTGWLSSVFNMHEGLCRMLEQPPPQRVPLAWEDRRLMWVVREPFRSRHSGAELVAGLLNEGEQLVVGSQMPTGGVIFSDGVESDFLEFNSGSIARFGVSRQRARLVVG